MAAACLVAALILQFLAYSETLHSMVSIWNRSETYTHGWIIGPISGYLIWLRRRDLYALNPRPSLVGAGAWAVLNLGWLIGHLAGAMVVKQYALVAMIPTLIWALLGSKVVWAIAFPLGFLMLMVPSGEAMVPELINFTADFTVKMLELTGIPVYREGTYFSVPSGDWNVVEACSGIRYLIASVTGGCLFAYLYYRTAWKRALVILAAILIPIAANGFRAYLIVIIGHLSGMRLAVGVDHFIYGWVFFGIVMFALFWVASLWRESDAVDLGSGVQRTEESQPVVLPVFGMVIVLVAAGVLWRMHIDRVDASATFAASELAIPDIAAVPPWSASSGYVTDWEPRYRGFDGTKTQAFWRTDDTVLLKILYYRGQSEGRELVSSTNLVLSPASTRWRVVGQRSRQESSPSITLRESELSDETRKLLIWDWYQVDGQAFSSTFKGKWLLAKDRLFGGTGEGAAVFIATPYEIQPEAGRAKLRAFLASMGTGIGATLQQVKGDRP